MRVFGVLLSVFAILVLVGGAIAIATRGSESETSEQPIASIPTTTLTLPVDGTAIASVEAATSSPPEIPLTAASPTAVVSNVDVGDPNLELVTFPLGSVEATYTESHQFGRVTVRFRPGAYTAEYAAEIARQTEAAISEANVKMQQSWDDDLTVFLADQLFAEDCLGCQGFTESDFRWIFMLDDGSVVPDEFEALLVHESAHLIAGNTIHLPFEIFYVEGLATWVMTDDLIRYGYVTPVQSTAWVYEAGALPSLQAIMDDDFAGRMRKRIYYDAAASFAFFVIETYGWESYISLYQQEPLESVLGKPLAEIEAEWHAYLEPSTTTEVNGVGAVEWWNAASEVIDGFGRFYENPSALSAEQYRLLTLSRLAINRADPGNALAFLAASGV